MFVYLLYFPFLFSWGVGGNIVSVGVSRICRRCKRHPRRVRRKTSGPTAITIWSKTSNRISVLDTHTLTFAAMCIVSESCGLL